MFLKEYGIIGDCLANDFENTCKMKLFKRTRSLFNAFFLNLKESELTSLIPLSSIVHTHFKFVGCFCKLMLAEHNIHARYKNQGQHSPMLAWCTFIYIFVMVCEWDWILLLHIGKSNLKRSKNNYLGKNDLCQLACFLLFYFWPVPFNTKHHLPDPDTHVISLTSSITLVTRIVVLENRTEASAELMVSWPRRAVQVTTRLVKLYGALSNLQFGPSFYKPPTLLVRQP